ncbi:MAG: hypothetical protein OEZ13_12190 [Spirochaetia bacterium]|nr:hypothetical protein [Spirochaetia bacterium]
MELKNKITIISPLSILIIFLMSINIVSSDLRENDVRLENIRIKIKTDPRKEYPIEMKLNFQSFYGNFLIFYDYSGEPVYLKYRENQSDRTYDDKVNFLRSGITYHVKGGAIGSITRAPLKYDSNIKKIIDEYSEKKTKKIEKNTRELVPVIIGIFESAVSVEIDNIEF